VSQLPESLDVVLNELRVRIRRAIIEENGTERVRLFELHESLQAELADKEREGRGAY
jgi:hypothetical protein